MEKLSIHHNIRLSREERYFLQEEGSIVQIIGVSVPVWCNGEDTTEPAREIFCRYVLKNSKKDKAINIITDGYVITLPNCIVSETNKHKQQSYKNLVDPIDRGGRALRYRERNKATYKEKPIVIMHYVCIGDEDEAGV